MGRSRKYQKSFDCRAVHNLAPFQTTMHNLYNANYNETTTNSLDNNCNNEQLWWESLSNMSNGNRIQAYTPRWRWPCLTCGAQLLPSERQDFCCNSKIRSLISPLPQLPPTLQNLYINNKDIGHLSYQYNFLFSFMTLGYMGGVIRLSYSHAFIINGHSYHQIHSANLEELMIVNPFVQGLYQLRDTDYPQVQLVIQQATANVEIVASKGDQKEDESLSEEVEMHPEVEQFMIHKCTQRYMRQNKMCCWNYSKPIQENTVINELGHVCYRRCTKHDVNVVLYNAFLLLKLNSHINIEVASTSYIISYLYKYIYKGLDHATVNISVEENKTKAIDEIKNYLNICYLSAMEVVWRIFKYKIVSQTLSVTCLLIHLPNEQIILRGNHNNTCALDLLEDVTENEQCFNEAVLYNYCHLLEEHGIKISQIGLPQPVGYLSEVMHTKTQYNNYNELVAKLREMINQLNSTILESIKSSSIWNTFKINNLQQPIRDALDPEYSQLMDDIGDRISGENVSLTLLNTIYELENAINFIFLMNILNNPIACLKRAILSPLNIEVNLINDTVLQ
ncbi:42066_t:CDS:2 [Gigaspora margarita]|uniref:42066_t:CDS:1 n=1 Tax=Gigaspora margarita TaxID=4874 RepID=A0ABN7UL24_GIGMA|nr:42066_t:CDS:2 [Gigaspora margarita]